MAVTWMYVSNEHMPNMNERSRWIYKVHVCQVRRERSSAVHEQRHEQNRNGNRNRSNTRRYHHVRVKLQKFSSSMIFLTTFSIMKSFYRLFTNQVTCSTSLSRFFPLYSVPPISSFERRPVLESVHSNSKRMSYLSKLLKSYPELERAL